MLNLEQFKLVLMQLAGRLGASMQSDRLDWPTVQETIWEILQSSPITAGLDPQVRADLADTLGLEASRVAVAGPTAAFYDIRDAMQPLMAAKKPMPTLFLAAYRIANGRLTAREVEDCVREETVVFMRRLNATKKANSP